jgi:A/G-specific adenine glycosylase
MDISEILIKWYLKNKRDLPWRNSMSPYHIWLSEIILQQTRVNQGIEYYLRFVARYPDVKDMAEAPLEDILKMWQGLGYYSRARNMHDTARQVANAYGGLFPDALDDLIKLKGIGKYTAAAVASMAYNKPVALVDGNVYRVISRIFGISHSIDSAAGKQVFSRKAQEILDHQLPGIHNQAMMELGALICVPRNPLCHECVVAPYCIALKDNRIHELPVKKARTKSRTRYFNYIFPVNNGNTIILRREHKDIWHLLYEFPLIETDNAMDVDSIKQHPEFARFAGDTPHIHDFRTYKHLLTHQTLICNFVLVHCNSLPDSGNHKSITIKTKGLNKYAVPRIIDRYIADLAHEGLL